MADEPTLPSLPKVSWDAHSQTFTNTRKRDRDGAAHALFSNSSDPAMFSSDDDPHIDNYVNGRHRKKRYVGSWFQQMPASSDSTFGEASAPQPKPKRPFERQLDSGVWMGSDASVDLDEEEFPVEMDPPPESKLPQLRNPRHVPSVARNELVIRSAIDAALDNGDPYVDLSSLGVTTIPDDPIARLAELTLIPSVDRDVPFEQTNPKLGLFLSNNRLARAPGALFNLEHLTYLSLRNNQISELPPCIGKLRNLRELNLAINNLRYLPGELLNLLKFPSVLSSIRTHPNPFYRPDSRPPPCPELRTIASNGEHGDVPIPPSHIPLSDGEHVLYISPDSRLTEEIHQQMLSAVAPCRWRVVLLARSPVQYSDSRGSVLSRFQLPCEDLDNAAHPGEPEGQQNITLETEDVSVLSTPHIPGRVSDTLPTSSHVLSLYELALKSASRAAQTWDLASYLPPQAPQSILRSIGRLKVQSASNGNLGSLPCSTCERQIITPLAQWIEWWDISKQIGISGDGKPILDPLSMDANENVVPFLKRGCSWNCIPKDMEFGQCAPGTLLF
ncbi:hypothetical protein F4802DRAFT_609792 [Xylaria palmicola]|nr:hypothetical protein F4802DRAFT_609792 [Xylaria palmicola]